MTPTERLARYRMSVMVGKAARLDHLYDPAHDTYARMGHYWWFWLPFHHWNGGSFKAGSVCVDHSFKWLCFWVTVTFWRTK